jgi:hypothetical protein
MFGWSRPRARGSGIRCGLNRSSQHLAKWLSYDAM